MAQRALVAWHVSCSVERMKRTFGHEDWAETCAHYLHIRDTLETASAHGLSIGNAGLPSEAVQTQSALKDIVAAWLLVTLAVNDLNRSMGLPDMYPFVLPTAALDKLEFVQDLVVGAGASDTTAPSSGRLHCLIGAQRFSRRGPAGSVASQRAARCSAGAGLRAAPG